jgi:hypothetical protein
VGKTITTSFKAKLEKTVVAGFDAKQLEIIAAGFETKPSPPILRSNR